VLYQAPKGSCAACPFREQCAPSGRERTVGRSWGQDFVDAMEALLAGPLAKQRLVERKIYIEGDFGTKGRPVTPALLLSQLLVALTRASSRPDRMSFSRLEQQSPVMVSPNPQRWSRRCSSSGE